MLHRDISENNITITDPREADGFTDMLMDEDLAKEIDSGRSVARHRTRTMGFMAIEALPRVAHTYWHNLESFSTYCCGSAFAAHGKVDFGAE